MGLSPDAIAHGFAALASREPAFARVRAAIGDPPPRVYPRGFRTLLRTIVGQQVSVASADAVWRRMEASLGPGCPVDAVASRTEDELRALGLSRQKAHYAAHLAHQVTSGALTLDALPADDEAAIAMLTAVKGIGRWSAEIYLLFAEGRPDIWPAGDLAIQIAVGRLLGLPDRPTERATRTLADAWRPHRGTAAIVAWAIYNTDVLS